MASAIFVSFFDPASSFTDWRFVEWCFDDFLCDFRVGISCVSFGLLSINTSLLYSCSALFVDISFWLSLETGVDDVDFDVELLENLLLNWKCFNIWRPIKEYKTINNIIQIMKTRNKVPPYSVGYFVLANWSDNEQSYPVTLLPRLTNRIPLMNKFGHENITAKTTQNIM